MQPNGSVPILIADPDPGFRRLAETILWESGHRVVGVTGFAQARQACSGGEFRLVLSNLTLPDGGGLELRSWLRGHAPGVPFALMTGEETAEIAVEAMKYGAVDYLERPLRSPAALVGLVRRALAIAVPAPEQRPGECFACQGLIARAPRMMRVLELVRKVAPAPAPVLLVGEPGTGKGILARCLHHNSRRAGGPFLRLDCSELAPTLLESELFGHERAAYAGAGGPQTGLLERAAGGSVFLDAVGALDAPLQARLLAALREGAFERVGGRRPIHCDVRLIAADGPELPEAAAAGRFHHELYQRLSPFPIDIPPLRERQADIEPLARHFLARAAQRLEKPPFTLADAALRALTAHHWPGNVRELELLMERAALRAGRQVEREDLALAEPAGAAPRRIDEIVRRSILDALCRHNGNRTHAARELGISLRTLQYRLRDYGVTVPSAPAG